MILVTAISQGKLSDFLAKPTAHSILKTYFTIASYTVLANF